MKNPTKPRGNFATAVATDASSPGTLAMSTARCTWCRSISVIQRSASASGVPGASHPSAAGTATAGSASNRPPASRASVSKKRGEKKWQWTSFKGMTNPDLTIGRGLSGFGLRASPAGRVRAVPLRSGHPRAPAFSLSPIFYNTPPPASAGPRSSFSLRRVGATSTSCSAS